MIKIKSAQTSGVNSVLSRLEEMKYRIDRVLPLIQSLPEGSTIQTLAENDEIQYILRSVLGNDWFKKSLGGIL